MTYRSDCGYNPPPKTHRISPYGRTTVCGRTIRPLSDPNFACGDIEPNRIVADGETCMVCQSGKYMTPTQAVVLIKNLPESEARDVLLRYAKQFATENK